MQPGEHEEPDDSKQSHEEPSRIGRNNWGEKDSSVRKVTINNRAKEITHELDRSYDGIYLYKPGVELPNLFHLLNQSVTFNFNLDKSYNFFGVYQEEQP